LLCFELPIGSDRKKAIEKEFLLSYKQTYGDKTKTANTNFCIGCFINF
jgi:hypothetical protein